MSVQTPHAPNDRLVFILQAVSLKAAYTIAAGLVSEPFVDKSACSGMYIGSAEDTDEHRAAIEAAYAAGRDVAFYNWRLKQAALF